MKSRILLWILLVLGAVVVVALGFCLGILMALTF